MATVLISDAHGYPELIERALEHAGFTVGQDAFIYMGDFLDRGPDPGACFELVDRYATEVLLGNHEMAALVPFPICQQDPSSLTFRSRLIDRVLNVPTERRWKAAACVDGVLITHAGVSQRYQRLFDEECGGDAALLAARLNADFLAAIRQELETGDWDKDGILGDYGPLWLRPGPWSRWLPLAGVPQVAGHTPPLPEPEGFGFYMIDPCTWTWRGGGRRTVRYAMIEDGKVRVKEAACGAGRLFDSTCRRGSGRSRGHEPHDRATA